MESKADPRKTVPGWAVPDRPTDAEAEPQAYGSGVAVAQLPVEAHAKADLSRGYPGLVAKRLFYKAKSGPCWSHDPTPMLATAVGVFPGHSLAARGSPRARVSRM